MARLVFLLVFFLVFFLVPLSAQNSQNVTVRVYNQRTPTSGTSANLRNIGQSQHMLFVQFTSTGGTCAPGFPTGDGEAVYLEASFDGVSYFAITPKVLQLDGTNTGTTTANGIYPAIRVVVANNVSNCAVTVYYAGSLVTSPYPQTLRAVSTGYIRDAVSIIGVTPTVIANATDASTRIVVYGFWFEQYAAGTNTVEFLFYSGANCTGDGSRIANVNLAAAAAPIIFPTSLVPYAYSPSGGGSLCAYLNAAGSARVNAIYRME